jgi:hypothetical protein
MKGKEDLASTETKVVCFEEEITKQAINPKKLSWVSIPLRVDPVIKNLCTTEERNQCFMSEKDIAEEKDTTAESDGFESRRK